MAAPHSIFLASSNSGKLREYRELAADHAIDMELLPGFDAMPIFDETAPTFGENASGKAIHYSRLADGLILADDSGLVVPALGGAPGVHSARYAGARANSWQRNEKLLAEMSGLRASHRDARFVCVIAVARHGSVIGIISAAAAGQILEAPKGNGGFGYDPVFWVPELGRTFAQLSAAEKNGASHRGRAFRVLLAFLGSPGATGLAFPAFAT